LRVGFVVAVERTGPFKKKHGWLLTEVHRLQRSFLPLLLKTKTEKAPLQILFSLRMARRPL
jgi:hypothetical protein